MPLMQYRADNFTIDLSKISIGVLLLPFLQYIFKKHLHKVTYYKLNTMPLTMQQIFYRKYRLRFSCDHCLNLEALTTM